MWKLGSAHRMLFPGFSHRFMLRGQSRQELASLENPFLILFARAAGWPANSN
jgi:hypothetical protein